MRKLFLVALTMLIFIVVHEGTHALTATMFGEFGGFVVHSYGFEVRFNTPVPDRQGFKWAVISGSSNAITLCIGYILFANRNSLAKLQNRFARHLCYWLTTFFLILDALNLSILPEFFGGDVFGIAKGLGVNRHIIQVVFLGIFVFNRELLVARVFPAYDVKNVNPLWKPLFIKN